MYRDVKGREICVGDLLRSPHFVGARRKKFYLYHVAVNREGVMYAVPTSHMEPSLRQYGGDCPLGYVHKYMEILHGSGPGDCLSFEDRPRQKESI